MKALGHRMTLDPRHGTCVCGRAVDAHFDNRNRFVGCSELAPPIGAPGALTPRRRETVRLADEIARAAIGLRQAACKASDDELADEAQDVVVTCRNLVAYLLQRTLTPEERVYFDV